MLHRIENKYQRANSNESLGGSRQATEENYKERHQKQKMSSPQLADLLSMAKNSSQKDLAYGEQAILTDRLLNSALFPK